MGYINKADYIEKYGEEAWKAYLETRKAPRDNWRANNKEHVKEYHKQYCKNNKELINKLNRKSYYKNHDANIEANRKYYDTNRKGNKEYQKDKYQRALELHPDYCKEMYLKYNGKEKGKEYRKTKNGRAAYLKSAYNAWDKKRDLNTSSNITQQWIIDNIFNSSCIYCGDSDWTHLGADRIDNSKPHTPENCVCACGICNTERSDRFTVEEFKEYRKLHPRKIDTEKSWEIVEMKGIKVLKKRAI